MWDIGELRCAAPLRTAFDCARLMRPLTEAVVHVDMILACGFIGLKELAAYVAAHSGWRGVAGHPCQNFPRTVDGVARPRHQQMPQRHK